ncbi:MAG: polyprenyl synthetase family protein [Candidatus Bathyarchaeota archaeon]|uniref:polyprenyl synthetase family protein n=2 Tax=Candidatus Bathycorpusculum sp. TaxID=2994959 RepID=UPI0028358BAD|nr:polyprenyl synthetase family protein [Candidatus Termiticorpusculum sp.]MCL2291928.1 polyprenyl synthetase family protein [Candidatus Termiticorpusculum sp.]
MSQLAPQDAVVELIKRRGSSIMEKARQEILNTTYDNNGVLDSALKHYVKVNLPLVKPLFPALTSFAYEAATGNSGNGEFDSTAVAVSLIAFSADIHDDIIDQSKVKYAKKTVYGNFGSEVALLAGDALLIQGHTLLHKACEAFSLKQSQEISTSVHKALFELSAAEALDVQFSKKAVIEPDEYFETMYLKGVFAELQCRIGGIIGQANDEMLKALMSFGRTIGMLGTLHDEFCDMFDASELEHRVKFECPPLPMIYALQDEKIKVVLKELVGQVGTSKTVIKKIAKLVLESEAVCMLKHKINAQIVRSQKLYWSTIEKSRVAQDMLLLSEVSSSFDY